jgi:hypothetical protein
VTVAFLALKLGRPLFPEGEAGVGKTEVDLSRRQLVADSTPLPVAHPGLVLDSRRSLRRQLGGVEICGLVYRPQRARDSPRFRLVEQHLEEFLRVYPECFALHVPS